MKKYCYIFIRRNMGNGYTEAYPKCSIWKNWIFDRFLKPLADSNFQEKANLVPNYEMVEMELESDIVAWHGHYAMKFERKPDPLCQDPLAKGRLAKFSLYLFMEGEPAVLPAQRFHKFVEKCIDVGFNVLSPGENEILKIQIPDEFFEL